MDVSASRSITRTVFSIIGEGPQVKSFKGAKVWITIKFNIPKLNKKSHINMLYGMALFRGGLIVALIVIDQLVQKKVGLFIGSLVQGVVQLKIVIIIRFSSF